MSSDVCQLRAICATRSMCVPLRAHPAHPPHHFHSLLPFTLTPFSRLPSLPSPHSIPFSHPIPLHSPLHPHPIPLHFAPLQCFAHSAAVRGSACACADVVHLHAILCECAGRVGAHGGSRASTERARLLGRNARTGFPLAFLSRPLIAHKAMLGWVG